MHSPEELLRQNSMPDVPKTYVPNPELVKALAGTGETLFQFVCRHAELVRSRESKSGTYSGDGPTSQQVDSLVASLAPVFETPDPHAADVVWHAFRAAVDVEMTWAFPERDPIGEPMTAALREVQSITGWALEQASPESLGDLHRYVDLAVVANAARRQQKLSLVRRTWSTLLMALARFLWWAGGGKRG